ncbi:uncharacterized protein LOC135928171 [Gordionus sp. m RMFG-2023]|uniref:uncharacterized protein LOC135928171 n=1 Tax=Gordionus sp. m RMFG-2023 TaxID=3053472 RepID=UPI0031FBA65C
MNIFEVGVYTQNDEKVYDFCLNNQSIPPGIQHTCCNSVMRVEKNNKSLRYRCSRSRRSYSIWKDSIFEGIHDVGKFLRVVYLYISRYKILTASKELDYDKKAISRWFKKFRKVCGFHIASNHSKIGGPGHVIEIDETHVWKRKYNSGRHLTSEAIWIIGGICRETNEIFLSATTTRDQDTTYRVVKDNVMQDSTIMTDSWLGYNRLESSNYFHYRINHSQNFVDPNDRSIHTQKVERLWRDLKANYKRHGDRDNIHEYLLEYRYFRKYRLLNRFDYISI